MKLKAFYDTIITTEIREKETEEKTKSGLILMGGTSRNMKPMRLEVVARGPEVPEAIKEGSILLAFPGTGAETEIDGTVYRIIRSKDIPCMIEEN